jgi:hypothetical protein
MIQNGVTMAQGEDPAQAARRLEAALERIAYGTDRLLHALPTSDAPRGEETPVELAEIAERLDALIAQLRRTLAGNDTAG